MTDAITPRSAQMQAAPKAGSPGVPAPSAPLILIVEDSAIQATMLKRFLLSEGYQVAVANNGIQGLKITQEQNPALVLSDINMPEMNGFELCSHIKKAPQLQDIPVVLMTSLTDVMDVIKGLECKADNFLIKPYDNADLLVRIKYMLLSRDMYKQADSGQGVPVFFAGTKHYIDSDHQHILSLLLSVYETAVLNNKKLLQIQEEMRGVNEKLESMVAMRTKELTSEVAKLQEAEKKIYKMNLELESRVNERTAELQFSNAELKKAKDVAEEIGRAHV